LHFKCDNNRRAIYKLKKCITYEILLDRDPRLYIVRALLT